MPALNTPGLNRWERMQSRPFGTNTNMSAPTPAQSDYKRQAQDYGQALRNLRRAGRRGDAQASLAAVDVANEARTAGIQGVQGIRRAEDQTVAAQRYEAGLGTMAQGRENAIAGATQTPRLDSGVQTPRLDAMGPQTPRLGEGATTAATGELLQKRKGLFERMKTGVTPGMESEAAGLGVTASGWQKGLSRLGTPPTAKPSSLSLGGAAASDAMFSGTPFGSAPSPRGPGKEDLIDPNTVTADNGWTLPQPAGGAQTPKLGGELARLGIKLPAEPGSSKKRDAMTFAEKVKAEEERLKEMKMRTDAILRDKAYAEETAIAKKRRDDPYFRG